MRYAMIPLVLILCATAASAQEAGNQVYQRDAGNQIYNNQGQAAGIPLSGDLLLYDPKDLTAAPYVEASVLMNVKPDAFVAVFGVAQEGPNAVESNGKVDRLVASFTSALQPLGVRAEDVYVDFISQNPVYDYTVTGKTARESLTGFQTKKTVAVRYTDRSLLTKMTGAAAQLGVYDLIKVDYVVSDMGPVRQRLVEEASKVIARKEADYNRLFGIGLKSRSVAEERYATYTPGSLYKTYTAFESGNVETSYGSSTRVVEKRKSTTSYYDPLTSAAFDAVINPAGIEPTVQCTLFLKVRCAWTGQ